MKPPPFTDRARKVIQLANQEAQRYHHEYIAPEHLLVAIVKEGSGIAALVLRTMSVDLESIQLEVEKLLSSGPEIITMGKLPQTVECKKVIQNAMEEADDLGHKHVGTEHFLLALTTVEGNTAGEVLNRLGLDAERVRELILELVDSADDSAGTPAELPMNSRANRAINHARQAAIKMGAWFFDTEHLLIGIAREYGCDAAFCLRSASADVSTLLTAAMQMFPTSEPHPPTRISMGSEIELAFQLANQAARRLGHKFINAEHLMLGLIGNVEREVEDPNSGDTEAIVFNSTKILESLDVDIAAFKEELLLYVKHGQHPDKASPLDPLSSESINPIKASTPLLNRFGINLTRWAQYQFSNSAELDPSIVEQISLTLMRRNRNNVLLVGDRQSATVYFKALAQVFSQHEAPSPLKDLSMFQVINFSLDPKTSLAERLVSIFNEARNNGHSILAIEDIAELFDFKTLYNRKLSLLSTLVPWLRLPRPQVIAFVAPERFEELKILHRIMNCFDVFDISDFKQPDPIVILQNSLNRLEDFHLCTFAAGIVDIAVELCRLYLPDADLVEEARILLDRAAAANSVKPLESQCEEVSTLQSLDDQLRRLEKRMQTCREHGNFDELLKLDQTFDTVMTSRVEIQLLPVINIQMIESTMAANLGADDETIVNRKPLE